MGKIQDQCGTRGGKQTGDFYSWIGAWIGAESPSKDDWSWNDGSAWDFVNEDHWFDNYGGEQVQKISFISDGTWHDWGKGDWDHSVVCRWPE